MGLFDQTATLDTVFGRLEREFLATMSDVTHPFRLVPLSTYSGDSRYVVLRGFDSDFNFDFYTDSRTSKVGQIIGKPTVGLLFYHPQKRVQIRVKGSAQIHHQDETTAEIWKGMADEAKKAYGSIVYPGKPIKHPTDAHIWPEEIDDRFFTKVSVRAERLDVMQLDGFTHLRAEFLRSNEGWTKRWIVP